MNKKKTLSGRSFLQYDNPKKIIFMLHGYGDNAENFVQIAKLLNQKDWLINYISINAPVSLKEYPSGYQWFDIYPNGKYISELPIVERKEITERVMFVLESKMSPDGKTPMSDEMRVELLKELPLEDLLVQQKS
mgnify:CR=1 FL=1